jgi:hypothetical protein
MDTLKCGSTFSEINLFNHDAPVAITSFICNCAGKNYCGETAECGEREKEKRVRDSVLGRNGFGIGHKFDQRSNFLELRDELIHLSQDLYKKMTIKIT